MQIQKQIKVRIQVQLQKPYKNTKPNKNKCKD